MRELTKDKLYEEYITNNLSADEIAVKYNKTKAQIKGSLRKKGIRKTALKLGKEKYDDRKWLYKEYISKKKGYTLIAEECGVSYTTILVRINYFGWVVRGHNDIDKGKQNRNIKRSPEAIEKIKQTRIKKRIILKCKNCEAEFERVSSKVLDTQKNYFCNRKCNLDYLKKNRKPKNKVTDTAEYKEWRMKVYKRDGFQCKDPNCENPKSRTIHAHHIFKRKLYPGLMFEVSNGITLCKVCHEKTYGKENQFIEFYVRIIQ